MSEAIIAAILCLYGAVLADAIIADPPWWPHPVRAIGFLANALESILTRLLGRTVRAGLIALVAALILIAIISALAVPVFALLLRISIADSFTTDVLTVSFASLLLSFSFASHELNAAGRGVQRALVSGDLPEARRRLSLIVSRQTAELEKDEIIRGTLESLSENWLDSVGAPIMWALLGAGFAFIGTGVNQAGGLIAVLSGLLSGAWTYRCVNTLDAMWGYRSTLYEKFGKAAARADDVMNYLPARLSALILVITALAVPRTSVVHAAAMCGRDGRKSRSPNSGWVEAACAGAIGVALGGPARYGGVLVENPRIGEGNAKLRHISSAITLNQTALALILSMTTAVLLLVVDSVGYYGR